MSLPNSSPLDSLARSSSRPILCYVTDRRSLRVAPPKGLIELLLEKIERVAAANVDWIQLREKDLPGKDAALLTREAGSRISKLADRSQTPTRLLVNDRLDVALSEQSGGVHLRENSLLPADAKRLLRPPHIARNSPHDFLVGVSCHSLEAAQSAASAGADYIFFGPVFATPSKAPYGEPQGIERLAEVCRAATIPVLAIGGITLENVFSCFSAGAAGIAAIRLFQDSPDPAATVGIIRKQGV